MEWLYFWEKKIDLIYAGCLQESVVVAAILVPAIAWRYKEDVCLASKALEIVVLDILANNGWRSNKRLCFQFIQVICVLFSLFFPIIMCWEFCKNMAMWGCKGRRCFLFRKKDNTGHIIIKVRKLSWNIYMTVRKFSWRTQLHVYTIEQNIWLVLLTFMALHCRLLQSYGVACWANSVYKLISLSEAIRCVL